MAPSDQMSSFEEYATRGKGEVQKALWLEGHRRFVSIPRIFSTEWSFGRYLVVSCFRCAVKGPECVIPRYLRNGFEAVSQKTMLAVSLDFSHCRSCWLQDRKKDPRRWWKQHPEVYSNGQFTVSVWVHGWIQIADSYFQESYALFYGGILEQSSYYDAISCMPDEEKKEIRDKQREERRKERNLQECISGSGNVV